MSNTDHFPIPLPNDMPPLPAVGTYSPEVCATVRLYLAVLDDLAPEHVRIVLEHVRICEQCERVYRQHQRTARLLSNLPVSNPSPQVDQAVLAAIAARHNPTVSTHAQTRLVGRPAARRRGYGVVLAVAALAAVLLVALTLSWFIMGHTVLVPQAFALPSNLSWNGYVLYHSETRIDANGERYQVNSYDDLGSGRIHVESVMPGSFDVVAVGNKDMVLGLDMMHHVAQWGASEWSDDESVFNLAKLRSDMDAQRATYLDKDTFRGQPVYRIRYSNGLVLLLDMHYHPVNVLRGAVGPGTGAPIYDTLQMMPPSHVADSMWDMSVPPGFHMGTLPARP